MTTPNPFDSPTSPLGDSPGGTTLKDQFATAVRLKAVALTGQIITLAMAKGMIIIGFVFAFLMTAEDRNVANMELLLPIGAGLFAVALVGSFLVTKVLRSRGSDRLRQHPEVVPMREATLANATLQQKRQDWIQWDDKTPVPDALRPFLTNEQTATLIGQAILEGSAVVNLVFALIDGSYVHFVFAFFAWVGLVSMLPTIGKLRNRIDAALAPI